MIWILSITILILINYFLRKAAIYLYYNHVNYPTVLFSVLMICAILMVIGLFFATKAIHDKLTELLN